jgi:predicted Zn-dependent protease
LSEASRGRLDPLTGDFSLLVPHGRIVQQGALGDFVGPSRLVGRVADLLSSVRGVGSEAEIAGAGWCAKSGVKLPVWATAPAVVLDSVEVEA